MNWEAYLRAGGLLVVVLLGIRALRRSSEEQTATLVFFGPWSYFSYFVGIVLTPAKALALLYLGAKYVIKGKNPLREIIRSPARIFTWYWLYTVAITAVMVPFWPNPPGSAQDFLYSYSGRWITQLANLLLGIVVVAVSYRASRTSEGSQRSIRVLFWSGVILAVYGMYIWTAQRIGLPFTTIARKGGAIATDQGTIHTVIAGQDFVRAYSFAGEPKGLAAVIVLCIALLLFAPSRSLLPSRLARASSVALLGLLLLTLTFTLSTAGYVMLVASIGGSAICFWLAKLVPPQLVLGSTLVVLGIMVALMSPSLDLTTSQDVFEARFTDRLSGSGRWTYAEASMFRLWDERPLLLLTGVGAGGSSFYIRNYSKAYSGHTAAPRGVILIVADRGLIGAALLLGPIALVLLRIAKFVRQRRAGWEHAALILAFAAPAAVALMTYSHWYLEWVLIGICSATLKFMPTFGRTSILSPRRESRLLDAGPR